jgi:Domain of unknown function (DUF151)
MAYQFMTSLLEATGGRLAEARVTRLEDGTFYGVAVVEGPAGTAEVDARPSDILNLALLTGAPIRVDPASSPRPPSPSGAPATSPRPPPTPTTPPPSSPSSRPSWNGPGPSTVAAAKGLVVVTTKMLLACGAIAGPLFTVAWAVEGATRAHYNPLRHPVSSLELGDPELPTTSRATPGCTPPSTTCSRS